ncbi:MAG: tetratricopeptide repeat protein [Alteromonadaceae bacterium]|nr:tetratricopeptide repeat protein [Alteromonadaceae bacterium]
MSVINQMLKDLEQRDNESVPVGQIQSTPTPVSHSPKTFILITIIVVLLIVIGIFAWNLYTENQSLKQAAFADSQITALKTTPADNEKIAGFKTNPTQNAKLASELSVKPEDENIKEITSVNASSIEQISKQETLGNVGQNSVEEVKDTQVEGARFEGKKVIHEKAKAIYARDNTSALKNSVNKSSMAVTRRQISPVDLAAQKMSQAKKAIELNNLKQAEHLFEDILLLQPEHKYARKQLAALWFGRKEYLAALNLLSQGIVIDGQDSEFYLMKARIYLSQGDPQQAYQNLNALVQTKDIEYQLALANTAQQIGNFSAAITAYKILLVMQPDVGRWWLGLAVVFDRNSQFEQAIPAYRTALIKGDLSISAVEFSQQRLQELGG